MAQPVETATILNGQPFWMLLEMNTLAGEHRQTNRQTDGRYQTYYLPCFAVENKGKRSAKVSRTFACLVRQADKSAGPAFFMSCGSRCFRISAVVMKGVIQCNYIIYPGISRFEWSLLMAWTLWYSVCFVWFMEIREGILLHHRPWSPQPLFCKSSNIIYTLYTYINKSYYNSQGIFQKYYNYGWIFSH